MRVLLTRSLPPTAQARMLAMSPMEFVLDAHDTCLRSQLKARIVGCDAALVLLNDKIDGEILDAAGPQLKCISTMSVGYDHIDMGACRARGVRVGNTSNVLTDATADLTIGLLIATMRRFKQAMQTVVDGSWGEWSPTWMCGSQLTNKTIGIIGMGRIGRAIAQRLVAFKVGASGPKAELPYEHIAINTLLATSDVVIVTCALTSSTRHLIALPQLQLMKRSAVLINTARGPIIAQDDLVLALRQKLIAGVGLDVTDPEPIDPQHELNSFPNCLILPHGSATMETREAMAHLAIDNLVACLTQQPMPSEVL